MEVGYVEQFPKLEVGSFNAVADCLEHHVAPADEDAIIVDVASHHEPEPARDLCGAQDNAVVGVSATC